MKKFIGLMVSAAILCGSVPAYAEAADGAYTVSEINFDGFDREAAEKLYIDKLFGIDAPAPYANHGSELLTGSAKDVYEQLKVYVKEIADGKRTRTDSLQVSSSEIITTEDIIAARDFVIADCPECFYWTSGMMGYYPGNRNTNEITFYVASEYSVSGDERAVEVDPTKINKARKALENARSIAEKYDGLSDYEKICGYAHEICMLTDYDYSYQNHQLVNVFDGDDATKVVCEGYARAFQYLCDLGGIECYNVTGSDHRWNIVVLDGKSYHVDCTWADGFPIDVVLSYNPYILKGVAECDGKSVKFDFTVPGYYPTTESLTYDDETLAMYPQSILKVSTVDYEPPKAGSIKVDIKTSSGAPDTSGLKVVIVGSGESETVTIENNVLDISGLADGSYTMSFSANNCVTRDYNLTVSGGQITGDGNIELHLRGDINGDGKINTTDILKAKLQTKGSNKLNGYDLAVADANKDGKVNGTDVLKLKLHAKGSTKLW